ncbi:MAG: helix-turn-helix domain-containing protein [Piscinibacter sp.]
MDYLIQSRGQLASHLRALRKARGLSQAQLGAVLGVGQTRVTRIEHDPTAISVEQFLGILSALGVQMVLRPTGTQSAAGAPPGAPRAVATRAVASKRRPPDEPW